MKQSRKRSKHYKRSVGKRHRHILIVCEDSKTAPDYLKAFCEDMKLSENNVHVESVGAPRQSPSDVLKFAEKKIDKRLNTNRRYNMAYCVIDKDDWKSFNSIINKVNNKNSTYRGTGIKIIPSIPCIEVWFLFHFNDSTAPMKNAKSAISKLKKEITNYQKNSLMDIYHQYLKNKTGDAIKNSKQAIKTGVNDPLTYMHCLIEDLIAESKKA